MVRINDKTVLRFTIESEIILKGKKSVDRIERFMKNEMRAGKKMLECCGRN